MTSHHHDVTVLGAGWSGTVVTKYMLEEGLTVVALEKRESFGGIWYYSDDPNEKTTMKSTRTTSSATLNDFSDYPMPEEMGEFPHHKQMLSFLESYCKNFDLLRHMRFNTTVERVEKKGELWYAHTSTGETYTSRFLVVSTGIPDANDCRDTVFANFSGSIYHSKEIKEPIAKHTNCRLLIFGGGETAGDVCNDWYSHTSSIYWSVPTGQRFFRPYGRLLPWIKPMVYDKATSWILNMISPYHCNKPGFSWVCKWSTNGSLLAYQGHGMPEWKGKSPFMQDFFNKTGYVLDLIDYKRVVPKGSITSCNGKRVFFADGTSQEFDVVIMCTGYAASFPFLPEEYIPTSYRNLYKHVMDNEEPTLSFVGYIRPVFGSVFAVIEAQARWIAKMNSGNVALKSKEKRLEETKADALFWQDYFKYTSQRMSGLVEIFLYVQDMSRQIGAYPNFFLLFKRNTYHWWMVVTSPLNMGLFRINEPKHEDAIISTLERHRVGTYPLVQYSVFFVMRLIWFDWWLSHLERLKYKIQTSKRWPMIRDLPPVRMANWIWCLPKRLIFDNKTRFEPITSY